MFLLRYVTAEHPPDQSVTLTGSWWGWDLARQQPGRYVGGAWEFVIDETAGPWPLTAKLVLEGDVLMGGDDLVLQPVDGGVVVVGDGEVQFAPPSAVVTENGRVARLLFRPDLRADVEHDVLVVGSGMGGGLLADQLAEAGLDVLVLEAGSLLFPTHVGNLPRRLPVGVFDKGVWGLWRDFRVLNYANVGGSQFDGGQAFNLGGRSVFWGGLVPRMGPGELARWPADVGAYLAGGGYASAELHLGVSPPTTSPLQEQTKATVGALLPGFAVQDAPVAVQYQGVTPIAIPGGLFSTADVLTQARLVEDPGRQVPVVNLHHAVQEVMLDGDRATGVRCWDLLGRVQREYRGRFVVLAAGSLESPKIALQSGVQDDAALVGRGLTDHPIWFTHFALPPGSPHAVADGSAKVLARPPQAGDHPYVVVLEIGADYNQGRYVDPEDLARQREAKAGWTLCEVVVLFDVPLVEDNGLALQGAPALPVLVDVAPAPLPAAMQAEVRGLVAGLLAGLGAQPLLGEAPDLPLVTAKLGGVSHEVGTLRMGAPGASVVDTDLRFHHYENLFACDNSVFPSSPAANPSLTLAALALRLADRVAQLA